MLKATSMDYNGNTFTALFGKTLRIITNNGILMSLSNYGNKADIYFSLENNKPTTDKELAELLSNHTNKTWK